MRKCVIKLQINQSINQVSEVAINVLQSTPVKSSSSINPKFVCLESPIKANQATIKRITFIRTPKNQSQNTIIYSTNHELSPEFLRTASCLEQTNTLICIDGNNTHSVFPSMLRKLTTRLHNSKWLIRVNSLHI